MKIANTAFALSGLALAPGAVMSIDADAATLPRVSATNPAGICQGALPAFETAIRKRPLAVQNEGDSTTFVTCSFTAQGGPANSTYLNPTWSMSTWPRSTAQRFKSVAPAPAELLGRHPGSTWSRP